MIDLVLSLLPKDWVHQQTSGHFRQCKYTDFLVETVLYCNLEIFLKQVLFIFISNKISFSFQNFGMDSLELYHMFSNHQTSLASPPTIINVPTRAHPPTPVTRPTPTSLPTREPMKPTHESMLDKPFSPFTAPPPNLMHEFMLDIPFSPFSLPPPNLISTNPPSRHLQPTYQSVQWTVLTGFCKQHYFVLQTITNNQGSFHIQPCSNQHQHCLN